MFIYPFLNMPPAVPTELPTAVPTAIPPPIQEEYFLDEREKLLSSRMIHVWTNFAKHG